MSGAGKNGGAAPGPFGRRLAWFAGLYAAGLGTVTAVAMVIRAWLN